MTWKWQDGRRTTLQSHRWRWEYDLVIAYTWNYLPINTHIVLRYSLLKVHTYSKGYAAYTALLSLFIAHFRLHQIEEISYLLTVLINDSVAWYVCLSVTRLGYANTAERIEVLFGVESLENPRNIVHRNIETLVSIPLRREKGSRDYPEVYCSQPLFKGWNKAAKLQWL